MDIPWSEVDRALALMIEVTGPGVSVARTVLYVDEDGDGLDRGQEAQLGISDRNLDSDGDGIPDIDEWMYGLNPDLAADGRADLDRDGLDNRSAYLEGFDPRMAASRQGGRAGFLTVETWNRLGGQSVSTLTGSPRFLRRPDRVDYINRFELPPDRGNNYGSRVRGTVRAPETGEYVFWLNRDDRAELWLSRDGTPFERRRILRPGGYQPLDSWDRDDQRSDPVRLEAGREYYVELLFKEASGADFARVAWTRPGREDREIIGAEHLHSYVVPRLDDDGDGLPDPWERKHKLSPDRPDPAHADTDGDMLTTLEEYQHGTDPNDPLAYKPVKGLLRLERWNGPGGGRIEDLAQRTVKESLSGYQVGLERRAARGDHYGVRLRGWIDPPATGEYRFWIAGDDSAELWLAPGGDIFERELACYVEGWSDPRSFDETSHQVSVPVRLRKGEACFIEVLYKEFNGDEHLAVAWQVPGGERELVPAEALSSYVDDVRDADSDGLPDAWEKARGLHPRRALGDDANEGSIGDLDGDGIDNFAEYRHGLDPASPEPVAGVPGHLLLECWTNVPGRAVSRLVCSNVYCHAPDMAEFHRRARTRSNVGEHFGARLRGTVRAPVSGAYTFWIAGDDHCELWLGADASPFGRRCLAFLRGAVARGTWDAQVWQESAPVDLEAGREYHIEILQKEHTGRDFAEVAWRVPGFDKRETITRRYLRSHEPREDDADMNGLPDDWEAGTGLDARAAAEPGADGAFMDPDEDGLDNLAELRHGLHPLRHLDAEGVPGLLLADVWQSDEETGRFVEDFLSRPPRPPDRTVYLEGTEPWPLDGQHYFRRLRGTLLAPETGEYTFWIAADDGGELWLSPNARRFDRRLVALVDDWVDPRDFDRQSQQRSAPIKLEKGKAYYLEVLHKQGNGPCHLSLAWTPPGGGRELIPDRAVLSVRTDPDDSDDDGLLDEWEAANGLALRPGDLANPRAGALGDLDGDGLRNHEEYLFALDPQRPLDGDGLPGFLLYERWDNIRGARIEDLAAAGAFGREPDRAMYLRRAELPRDQGDWFGGRMRGLLRAPATGLYTFWISGDNGSELWLGRDERPFDRERVAWVDTFSAHRQFDRWPTQRSAPIHLQKGRVYHFECRHKEGRGQDHLAVAWRIPGGEREVVTGRHLASFVPDPDDLDDDGFSDTWERAHGLDPSRYDSPEDDLDGDGLSNHDEWLWGTAPDRADTDGDGVSDHDEIRILESDALAADVAPFVPVAAIDSRGLQPLDGRWKIVGDRLEQDRPSGAVAADILLHTAGVHLVTFDISAVRGLRHGDRWDLEILVDGRRATRRTERFASGEVLPFMALSPWLSPGVHRFELRVHNAHSGRRLAVHGLRVAAAAGPDADGDGTPDWVEARTRRRNRVVPVSGSLVSPAFVEGVAADLSRATNSFGLAMRPAPDDGWYMDVPLNPGRPARGEVALAGGLVRETLEIAWQPFDLLAAQPLTIRRGDALLLAATPQGEAEGQVAITWNQRRFQKRAGQTVTARFEEPGQHRLTGRFIRGDLVASGAVTVTVVDYEPAPAPVLLRGEAQVWTTPGPPASVALEWDADLEAWPFDPAGGEQPWILRGNEPGPHLGAARLEGEAGRVLHTIGVEVVTFHKGDDTGVRYAGVYPDGSQLVEMPVHISGITDDMRVELEIFVAGVVFEDGSKTLVLTAADFDENGWATVRFIRPAWVRASVCHRTRIYKGDQLIGYIR